MHIYEGQGGVINYYQGGGGRHLGGGTKILPTKREGGRKITHLSRRGYENYLT